MPQIWSDEAVNGFSKKNAEVESMYRKKILSAFTNVCTVTARKLTNFWY